MNSRTSVYFSWLVSLKENDTATRERLTHVLRVHLGHDTTAYALSYIIYEMARHPVSGRYLNLQKYVLISAARMYKRKLARKPSLSSETVLMT